MKRGHRRLLILLVSLICALVANSFFLNILTGYKMILFLIFLLVIFNIFYVLEKDNHRYFKDVLFEIVLFVVMFFAFYYLLGLLVGLYKAPNYYTIYGFKTFIIPISIYIILREILRYNLLSKAQGSVLCTVLVVVTMLLFDICDDFYNATFNSNYQILRFIAIILLPYISKNISYSFISLKMGYKPIIIFDLIFSLYPYLIPLIPNPSEYLVSIIYLLIPILFAYKIVNFFERKKDKLIPSNYHKKKYKGMIVPVIIVSTLVYFYSGYFKFFAIAIASGSMSPSINKGDIVIVDRKESHNNIKEGQVLAFKHEGKIVVHRIVKKQLVGDSYIYYTKGDANSNVDDLVIEEDMMVGIVEYRLPYIGYPTVWFNEK